MPQQEEWKFASVVYGVWFVMIYGIFTMLKLPAENLDYQVHIQRHFQVLHIMEMGQSYLEVYCAMEMRSHYWTALVAVLEITIAAVILKLLVLSVQM
jgi:hypothetical protein